MTSHQLAAREWKLEPAAERSVRSPPMANRYAANFGDVVKHSVLCEALRSEQPMRYVESHGGRFDYDLAELEPGPGGVWDFLSLSGGSDSLSSSAYARIMRDVAGRPDRPGRYPGSVALADALLPAGAEIVVFELVADSGSHLSDGLAERERSGRVIVADGLTGVCESALPGDFVLLDPFDVHARGEAFTSADAFGTLAARGVATVLWYAIYEPTASATWVSQAIGDLAGAVWHVRLVGDTTDGGLAGCGFLASHLLPDTVSAASTLVSDLASALAVVRPGLRVE